MTAFELCLQTGTDYYDMRTGALYCVQEWALHGKHGRMTLRDIQSGNCIGWYDPDSKQCVMYKEDAAQ